MPPSLRVEHLIFAYDILVTARSVDRCVTTLRNKIERNSQAPEFIRTIRDVGYRFAFED
jgi:DNA-binding response OmpR family regulator